MNVYRIRYKAISPIHIGFGKRLGIINQTRYFIPATNIWGAISANLAQRNMEIIKDYSLINYQEAQKFIEKNFFITNFYPVIENQVCLPKFKKEGFYYGQYPKYEFESLILDSYTSTALQMKTAEEGSLHEIEFLKNKVKGKDLEFEGYIGIKNDKIKEEHGNVKILYNKNLFFLKEIIKNISVGGERKYGFGRLSLSSQYPQQVGDIWKFQIEEDKIIIGENKTTPFYINIINNFNKKFIGDIEPIVGRLWIDDALSGRVGSGQKVGKYGLCIVPGSLVLEEIKIKLNAFGIGFIID
ncbi:MAG: hypothetical protein LWW95_07820 [Candidatus Desulfofervidus auxilii]|nr:hypothetical protein [Candidatus Desulfofervidus auxilii]